MPLSPRQDPCSELPSAAPRRQRFATAPAHYRSPCWSSPQQEGALLWSPEPESIHGQGTSQRKPSLHQPERCGGWTRHPLPARAVSIPLQSHQQRVPPFGAAPQHRHGGSLDVTHHPPKGHGGPLTLSHAGALRPLEADPRLGHCPQLPPPRGRRSGHGFIPTHKH